MATSQGATPANLYSGGNVVFNAEPYLQFQTNLLAREQAKNEALDNGYKDMLKGLTPAGLRSNDVPGFVDKVNGIQNFYLQNAEKIKNPRLDKGAAASEFNSRYNDALGYAQESKKAVDRANQFNQFKQKAQLAGQPITDQNIADYATDELPLNDPRHKDFDISTLSLTPKPLDLQKHLTLYSGIKPSKSSVSTVTNPNNPAETIETTTAVFSPDDIKNVASIAQSSYQTDPTYKAYIDKLANDPTKFQQYNDLYKHVMGKDFDVNHPEELAFAHDLSLLQQNNTSQKILPNPKYTQDREDWRQAAKFKHDDAKDDQSNLFIDKLIDNYISTGVGNPLQGQAPGSGKQINVDANLEKALEKKGAKLVELSYDNNNGQEVFTPKYYQVDEHGNVAIGDDKKPIELSGLEQPLNRTQLAVNLGAKDVTKKSLPSEVKNVINNKSYSIKGKSYTHSQLNTMGYTDDQINQAIKAGTIKP